MARYFTKPKMASIYSEPDAENYLARTIHEREPENTGILDINGNPIYRAMDKIGFIRDEN